jgi:hypothetical protein
MPRERVVVFRGAAPVRVIGSSAFEVPWVFARVAEGWDRIAFVSVGPFQAKWTFGDQPPIRTRDTIAVDVFAIIEWRVSGDEQNVLAFAANPDHEISLTCTDLYEKITDIVGNFDYAQLSRPDVLEEVRAALATPVPRAVRIDSIKSIGIESQNPIIQKARELERERSALSEQAMRDADATTRLVQKELERAEANERAQREARKENAEAQRIIRVEDARALLDLVGTPEGLKALFPDGALLHELELKRLEVELAKVTSMVDSELIRTKEELYKKAMDAIMAVVAPAAKTEVYEKVLKALRVLDVRSHA